jgi:predicted PurR-regulated permease PerM
MTESGEPPRREPRSWFAESASAPGQATRGQRMALVVGLLVVVWLALQLFASVLAPFVAAAGIAYVLDPPTTRLTRLGVGRGFAALLMILGLLAGVLVVGQILEGYVLYPRFLGDRVELPAVWVIFALFAGAAAFGFVGVMLAVPVAATIGVLCRFWLRRYLASPLYLDPPTKR